jgi:hypothetical protein
MSTNRSNSSWLPVSRTPPLETASSVLISPAITTQSYLSVAEDAFLLDLQQRGAVSRAGRRAWLSPDRFERWFARVHRDQLLGEHAQPGSGELA